MTITIEDEALERQLKVTSSAAGQSVPEFILDLVRDRVAGTSERRSPRPIDWEAIRAIQKRVAEMPTLDNRSDDELIGYNEHGCFD